MLCVCVLRRVIFIFFISLTVIAVRQDDVSIKRRIHMQIAAAGAVQASSFNYIE